jgi:DNA-binding MarR family transcriptional regulator
MCTNAFAAAGHHYLPEHFTMLIMIKRHENITQTDIARNTYKSKATITRIIDKLVNDGLVNKTNNPDDRRSDFLSLTDKGREIVTILIDIYKKQEAEAIKGISEADMEKLIDVLDTIRINAGA